MNTVKDILSRTFSQDTLARVGNSFLLERETPDSHARFLINDGGSSWCFLGDRTVIATIGDVYLALKPRTKNDNGTIKDNESLSLHLASK